jgi:hypothetical protein
VVGGCSAIDTPPCNARSVVKSVLEQTRVSFLQPSAVNIRQNAFEHDVRHCAADLKGVFVVGTIVYTVQLTVDGKTYVTLLKEPD